MKDRQLGGIDTQKEVRPQITALNKLVLGCKKCDLHTRRNKLVFGNGNPESSIVFIGEAPGREEDESGLPFVGSAGKQLTSMLKSVGIDRDAVYITNIIKCRPPGNRDPLPAEMNSCFEWLDKQLEIIAPKLICTLGKHSTFSLLGHVKPLEFHQTLSISKFRGKIYEYKGIKVVPTYHPAALLYHPEWKEATISDLTMVKKMLDRV
ncbi:MAG: uracil-DNA glycosylase [Candidatus Stahlbacteria bacterium]|nr:uracil-DNA glycosylase [Candidatus Stahlbacteria bacterium]